MPKIIITCGECGAEREIDEKLAGSILQCAECQASVRVPLPNISEGTSVGGFVLERQLGFGAMGEVWLARQMAMDRLVAVKLLAREYTLDSNFVDRFLKEVRISAKMDHPNIITAFDAGCDNDIHYLAITYVEGCTLEDEIERAGTLPEKDALGIMIEISDALRYAWNEFAILHRDIKPANIMIDKNGVAKLMDMGISKITTESAGLTMTGTIIGTPYYMSPEQGMGEKELDFHSDIYSLGATFYHTVTGVLPFDATTALGIVSKHITEPLPSPLDKNPELSEHCSALIEIMMAKGTVDRQDSWEEVVNDMRLVLEGKFPASKPRPSPGDSLVMPAAGAANAVDDLGASASEGEVVSGAETIVEDGDASVPAPKKRGGLKIVLSIAAAVVVAAIAAVFVLTPHFNSDSAGGDEPLPLKMPKPSSKAPETRKNPVAPTAVEPPRPKLPPKPVERASAPPTSGKDSKSAVFEEMWSFSKKHVADNPENYDLAIKNFREISENAAGTKYKMMADIEIARLTKLKKRVLSAILADLRKKGDVLAESGDFAKAAELCGGYSGKFTDETAAARGKMVAEYAKKGEAFAEAERRKVDAEKRKCENAKIDAAVNCVSGDWSFAKSALSRCGGEDDETERFIAILNELTNSRKAFLDNLRKHVGEYVTVQSSRGVKRVKIKRVKGRYIYCVEKKGEAVLHKRYPVSRISKKDVFRITEFGKDAVLACEVAAAVKKRDVFLALDILSKRNGAFQKFLKRGVLELDAKDALFFILDFLSVDTGDFNDQKRVVDEIGTVELPDAQPKEVGETLGGYRVKFAGMRFLKRHELIVKALEAKFGVVTEKSGKAGNARGNGASVPRHSSVAEGRSARSATSKFDLSHLDPKSIRCPDDMRDMVLKISSDYDERGGFFFDRHGDLVMVDLYGAGGVNNDVVKLLGLFPSLKMIRLGDTDVSDISPLEHCALDVLDLEKTDVEDLSPLKDMKTLKTLKLNDSNVKSLEPLRKLPLEMLDISGTNVSDLSPLAGMPLKGLRMVDCDVTKYSVLKGLRSLEALEPSGLWRKIPGKADNEGREQFFPKIHRLPPPKRRRRDDRRDFR